MVHTVRASSFSQIMRDKVCTGQRDEFLTSMAVCRGTSWHEHSGMSTKWTVPLCLDALNPLVHYPRSVVGVVHHVALMSSTKRIMFEGVFTDKSPFTRCGLQRFVMAGQKQCFTLFSAVSLDFRGTSSPYMAYGYNQTETEDPLVFLCFLCKN